MPLNLEKVSIDKATQYLEILTKKKTREVTQDSTLQRIDEIEDELAVRTDEINKLGRSLLLYPIKEGDLLTSTLYNAIINGTDDDVRNVSVSIQKITTVLNKLIDTINRYHKSMMDRFNESITEIRNITKLSESSFEFNDFISDSFTSKTNDFQFREAAENKEDNGLYKMAAFADDTLVAAYGDAYTTVQVLNDNITTLYESGSLFEENIDEAYNIIGFAEQPSQFIGDIAGTQVIYNGMLIAVIVTMPAKRLTNHISFSQFASSAYEIFGMYKSNNDTRDYKSSDWQQITDYHSDAGHKGSYEFNLDRSTFQSLMIVFGQPVFKNKRIDINPDRISRLVHNIEDEKFKKLIKIEDIYNNALANAGIEIIRKDDIKYVQPSGFAGIARGLLRFLDYFLKILKPETFITHKEGYLYDVGVFKLRLKYKEYRSFSIFESSLVARLGNITSCQLAKNDYVSGDVFIKYFVKFESITKRLLGINEEQTTDIYVIADSTELVRDLDFLARPHTSLTPLSVYVNGVKLDSLAYEVIAGDDAAQVIQAIKFTSGAFSFGDIVKVTYSISKVDANYNQYHPYLIDITKELGIPNLRDNILTDPIETDVMVITNPPGSFELYVPATSGSTIRKGYLPPEEGQDPVIGWYIEKTFAVANLDPTIYDDSEDINLGTPPGVRYHQLSGERLEQRVDNIYRGIIDEPKAYDDIELVDNKRRRIPLNYEYLPGTVVVRINDKYYYTDGFAEGATGTALKKVTLKTKIILSTDIVSVSYLPLDDTVISDHATSNIADYNKYEVKAGTQADSSVQLLSFPYIDFRIINGATEDGPWIGIENRYSYRKFVSLTYAPLEISIGGIPAKDVTPYQTADKPELSPYLDKNYEYYIQGNRIYFNTYIDPDSGKDITIRYYTLGSRIRLRAELFRNNLRNQSITPEMYDYTLLLNVT